MKKSKRFLSLLLAVAMVMGLMLSGVSATTVASEPKVVFAEDFENETEFPVKNDVADLAHEQYWGAGAGEIVTVGGHTGSGSVKLTATAHTNSGWHLSDWAIGRLLVKAPIDNFEVGATYEISAWFKSSHASGVRSWLNVQVDPYSANTDFNPQMIEDNTGTEWVQKKLEFTVPETETPYLVIRIGSGYYLPAATTEETVDDYCLLVDDIQIVKTKDAPTTEPEVNPNEIFAEDFEDATELPIGDLVHEQYWNGGNGEIITSDAHDSDKSVKLTGTKHTNTGWHVSDWGVGRLRVVIPMDTFEAGATYKISAWFKASHATGLRPTLNAQNEPYSKTLVTANFTDVGTEWVLKEAEFEMPADLAGTGLNFHFGSSYYLPADTTEETYQDYYLLVDDIQIVKTKDAPKPEPETPEAGSNEIFAEDFENETEFPVKNDIGDVVHDFYWGAGAGEIATDAHTGSGSAKLTATAHTNTGWHLSDWAIGRMLIKIPAEKLEAGATYKVTAWFKSSHATGVRSWFNVQTDPYNGVLNLEMIENNTGTEWVQKELEFTAEAANMVIKVGSSYYLPANTTEDTVADYYLLVDDIQIVKTKDAPTTEPDPKPEDPNPKPEEPVIDPAKPWVESFENWADSSTVITDNYSVPGGSTSWNGATPAEGWAINAQNGKVIVQPVLGGAQDGNVSMKLTIDGTNSSEMNRTKLSYILPAAVYEKMEHGAEYTFTVYFKGTAGKGNFEIKTYVPGVANWPSVDVVVGSDWTKAEYKFVLDKETPNPAAGVSTINFFIGIPWHTAGSITGDLYIDNVSLIKTKDAPKEATSITIPENLFVALDGTETLKATLEPMGVTADVVWSSSDETVATVDANGNVTGLKIGTAVITATSGSVSDTCNVVVYEKQETDGLQYTEGFESATGLPVENIFTSIDHEAYWEAGAAELITSDAHDGSNSIKLTPSKHSYGTATWVTSDYAIGRLNFQIPIEDFKEGAHYKISAWFKSSHAEGVRAYFNVQSAPYTVLNGEGKYTNVGTEWVKKEFEFIMPAKDNLTGDMLTFRVGCSDYMPKGTNESNFDDYYLLIDDITIEQVPWVDDINLVQKEVYLEQGDTMDLIYDLVPADQNVFVSFTSSAPSIAEVDANGKITAKKIGTAEITIMVSHGNAIAKCKVHVVEEFIKLESISIDKTTLDINPGWQGKLNVTFNPSNAMENTVDWTSSDESVVKVDENGNLLALKTGTATITATTTSSGKTATCTVTVADNADYASTSKDITVSIGQYEIVDLSKILSGKYTVLSSSYKGKAEIIGNTLKYTAYTWQMQDGNGFTDAVYTDTVKVAAQDGDKAAIITVNVTIGKLEELFYDENGEWITDVDMMFTEEYLEAIKADLKNNPDGERAKILEYMLSRVDKHVGAGIPEYYDRKFSVEVEYDTDLRPYADIAVNFLLAYLLTKDLPGYEAKNEVYLQETIRYAEAALAYPYWGATHWGNGAGWRNADLPAGHFLFSTAMVYYWLKDELKDETCTYRIGAKDNGISNPLETLDLVTVTENMPTLDALEHRLWFVCEEMYSQCTNYNVYINNHMNVRMGGLTAATIALRADAETQAEKDLLVKYTGMILYKDGMSMYSLMPDGTSQEGVAYWEYGAEWIIKAGTMLRDTLNIDMFDMTGVLSNSGEYLLYNLLPSDNWTSANSVLNLADSPTNHWYGPEQILRFIAKEYGNANAQWLANEVQEAGIGTGYSQWMNVMFYTDEVESEAPALDNTLHWFKDLDIIIARSDWSGDEDMLVMKCGIPFGKNLMQLQKDGVYPGRADAGHAHPDANHISLYANGEFLIRDDGYYRKFSANHNTLLINGKGQLGEGGDWLAESIYLTENAQPHVKLAESNAVYDYIVGDATEAYSKELKLDLFERNTLWLKEEQVLLVVDNIKTSAVSDLELRWFPQSKNIGPSGDVYIIQSAKNTMNFYPVSDDTTTACEDLLIYTATSTQNTANEKGFRQTYRGTDWQNAVAFAWNEKGEEVAYVTYVEGENANEHVFGVNGKIYTINVETNEISIVEGELKVEGDDSASDSTLSTVLVNGVMFDEFDPAVKEYTIDRWWKTADVTIDAYTGAYGAKYEVEYSKDVITLTCTSRDGTSETTYTFKITNSQNLLGIAGVETDRPREGFDIGWTYDNVITPTNVGNIWANTGLPTVIYDLGKVCNLEDVIIAFNISARRDSYYDLLYSIDGENWISLQEDATVKQTDGALNSWHDPVKVVDDANVNARYVKVKLRAHSQNAKDDPAAYCSIQEITFIGSEYPVVDVTGGAIADAKDFYEVGDEITVTAEVPEGKKFVRWEVEGVDVDNLTAATITFTLGEDDVKLVAIFEDVIVDDGGDDGDDDGDDKDDDGASDTGDNAMLLPALLLAVMALVACAVLTVGKKYRR